jgi:hypothetical protein
VVGVWSRPGIWQPGDQNLQTSPTLATNVTRLVFVLSDLLVDLVGRIRCDRVLRLPTRLRPATTGRCRLARLRTERLKIKLSLSVTALRSGPSHA